MFVVSVDLWGTLIKSSPKFVDAKVALTKKYFKSLNENYILECFKQTKNQLNNIIENTGWQPSEEVIFKLLFTKLNSGYEDFTFIKDFIDDYQKLAIQITPSLYSQDTSKYLKLLSQENLLQLSSNTMLINGNSLEKVLEKLELIEYFDRLYFSDRVGFSKPNFIMYGNSDFHIGDNILTDGIGAEIANSIPIIINSNKQTIKDAFNIIIQRGIF